MSDGLYDWLLVGNLRVIGPLVPAPSTVAAGSRTEMRLGARAHETPHLLPNPHAPPTAHPATDNNPDHALAARSLHR